MPAASPSSRSSPSSKNGGQQRRRRACRCARRGRAAQLLISFAHSLKRSKDCGHPQRRHAVQRGATRNHFSGVGFPCLALLALADVVDRAPRQHAYDARHTLRRCGQIGIVFEVESPLLIFRRVRLLDRAAELERPARRPSPVRGEWVSDEVHERVLEELNQPGDEPMNPCKVQCTDC